MQTMAETAASPGWEVLVLLSGNYDGGKYDKAIVFSEWRRLWMLALRISCGSP